MTTNNTKRLLRTPDGIIAGVCGGLAEFFGLDVSLICPVLKKVYRKE